MAQPVIVQEPSLRQFAHALCGVFSLPQWKYLVTVLLGLLQGDGHHTLSGLLRQVAVAMTVCGLSRFLKQAPWSVDELTAARQARFYAQVAPEHWRSVCTSTWMRSVSGDSKNAGSM